MNPLLQQLQAYPFEKLAALKHAAVAQGQVTAAAQQLPPITLSIGEPKHAPPAFVLEQLSANNQGFGQYPSSKGLPALREAIAQWLNNRFQLRNQLSADDNILPVNGTREALFAFAQAVIDPHKQALVMMPNPFYQIYEGAALLAGAEPLYLNNLPENHYQTDYASISEQQWQRCQLLYLCSPNNPTGAVTDLDTYKHLITLADRYNFIIASDECYSEIYPDEQRPPPGLLQACAELGRDNYQGCVVFHSLSKRSNLPGLRSGFVAGDKALLASFLRYRTYHGCAMPLPIQAASIAAWGDEAHVVENRRLYQQKFLRVAERLKDVWTLTPPQAGFNFWAKTPENDQDFSQRLFAEQQITLLPGSYLSRRIDGVNPGTNHVRIAMVAALEECEAAAERINTFFSRYP
ncbi:MAG: succinyldiaminopimelate transaminase [Cellvibrionaceae bacterium]|nr:succinyldiaminopimelate transaminase [Cellvibrionaceae bacterium]